MKKPWRKTCMTVLTIGLLTFGGAGCSDDKNTDEQSNVANEEFDFSQLTNRYPIPDPIQSPEEIKAAGGEVTADDIMNAFECLAYRFATEFLGESDVVSSKFISITTFGRRQLQDDGSVVTQDDGSVVKEYDPFYAEMSFVDGDFYHVGLNIIIATANMELPRDEHLYLPTEFGTVLDSLGITKKLITREVFRSDYYLPYIGKYVYDPVVIDRAFIEQFTSQASAEEMETVLGFIYEILTNYDKLFLGYVRG
ncbi:MAG: hypothetical protein IKB07_01050 [Lachnospiraceae bacterium]|nr:hypothetical protein [Lachnospiraceae bacterium]